MTEDWTAFVERHGDVIGYLDAPLLAGQAPLSGDVPSDNPLVVVSRHLGFPVYPVYSIREAA